LVRISSSRLETTERSLIILDGELDDIESSYLLLAECCPMSLCVLFIVYLLEFPQV
jgi:hypothetical protein